MFNSGVYVQVNDPAGTWYGVINSIRNNQALVTVGGTDRMVPVAIDQLSLHPSISARRLQKYQSPKKRLNKIIVAGGNATGDLFGLTTALKMHSDHGILVLQEVRFSEKSGGRVDRSLDLLCTGIEAVTHPNKIVETKEEFGGIAPIFDDDDRLYNTPSYIDIPYYRDIETINPSGRCKSVDMLDFLRQSLGPAGAYQIFVLPVDNINHWYGKLTRGTSSQRLKAAIYVAMNARNEIHGLCPALTGKLSTHVPIDSVLDEMVRSFEDIAKGTRLLSSDNRASIVTEARRMFCMNPRKFGHAMDETFYHLLNGLKNPNSPPHFNQYLVIWSRFSGKTGGPHPQHDTSYTGLNQLIELAASRGVGVILAGDVARTNRGFLPYYKINPHIAESVSFDLRTIWKAPAWQEIQTRHSSTHPRILQMQLFDYLNRTGGSAKVDTKSWRGVLHVGMRSGNLEAYALIGHRVFYMEDVGNLEAARMEAWHSPNGPQYDRIEIERTPTRTGKYIQSVMSRSSEKLRDNEVCPWKNTADDRRAVKQAAISKLSLRIQKQNKGGDEKINEKGFISEDMNRLSNWLDSQLASGLTINGHGYSTWGKHN